MRSAQRLTNAAALACLASLSTLPRSTGVPFANNPYTNNPVASVLSKKNPAYGSIPAGLDQSTVTFSEVSYSYSYTETSNSYQYSSQWQTTSGTPNQAQARRLEASNTDIQKIEQHFNTNVELNVKNLSPSAAYYVMPWPSSYWASFQDGINYKWSSDGEPSPAEKYATAYGLDRTVFMDAVSAATGVLAHKTNSICTTDDDCKSLNDGSVCARRAGEQQGYCIPSWYGICHAWSPAALLEPEPRCVIEKNGVTFHPMDIKALLSQVYDDAKLGTVYTGARYYGSDISAPKDRYGRYMDGSRRDLGPGFMHVALTNILGRFNTSVVVDVAGGFEVWNQPIYSYEVVTQTEMMPSQAASQYFGENTYPFNSAAQRMMYTELKLTWMVESLEDGGLVSSGRASTYTKSDTYKYLLELDNDYNILGGEWVAESMDDHPDFLWFPKERPALSTVTGINLSYQNVRELLDLATNC